MIVVGLQTLDKARDWYLGQLSIVEEKMRDVGRNGQLWVSLVSAVFCSEQKLCLSFSSMCCAGIFVMW
jgi:hypothetical protein